jgi:hypothetical protein
MRRALGRSIGALAAAFSADLDRTDEDRAFFQAERAKLEPLAALLRDAHRALDDFDLGPGEVQQAQVAIGDEVLDRGVRAGNTRTKLGLRGKPGLGAAHVFGERVDDLVKTPVAKQPAAVLAAVERFEDVPAFDGKDAVRADLTARATQQDGFLKQRDEGAADRTRIQSQATRLVVESALALASLKGALDQRFPRQRLYVGSFFLDVGPRRTKKNEEEEQEQEQEQE